MTKSLIVLAACIALVAGVVFFVGSTVFRASVDSKMALETDAVEQVLVAPAKDATSFYTLVSADLDDEGLKKLGNGPDALALVRVDTGSQQVAAVVLPANSMATLSDGKANTLREAALLGDDELVRAASALAGVDVAHFVKTDAEGIRQMVDQLGGVQMDVAQEIDDPVAGSDYIEAGQQLLSGDQVLTLLRATNLQGKLSAQVSNQVLFMTELALKVLGDGSVSFVRQLELLAGHFATDVKAKDAENMADALRGITADQVQGALAPGYEQTSDGAVQYICSGKSIAEMLERAAQSQPMVLEGEASASVDPSSFTITVRNGSGVAGGASQLAAALTNYGYNVTETGNTDSYAYTETLVIYADSAFEDACQSVVDSLGSGRVVNGAGFYTFDTDVLVVLGSDWTPVN